ncbi:hypothetical protein MCAMS1_02871 [biofilm metagenome]
MTSEDTDNVYRVYARWADQKVKYKTQTYSRKVAEFAWEELKNKQWPKGKTPSNLVFNCTGRDNKKENIGYVNLENN